MNNECIGLEVRQKFVRHLNVIGDVVCRILSDLNLKTFKFNHTRDVAF